MNVTTIDHPRYGQIRMATDSRGDCRVSALIFPEDDEEETRFRLVAKLDEAERRGLTRERDE